jgi:hypothetical protein
LTVLDEATLDVATLVAAVQRGLAAPPTPAAARPRMDGAAQSVRLLQQLMAQPALSKPL